MKPVLRFFTSVRLAIVLFIFIILASVLGTLLPQGRSAEEYLIRYGQLGSLLEKIQLTRVYQSVWYIALLSLFSLNIIVCTLTRLSPKVRRVFRPKMETEVANLFALKIKARFKIPIGLFATKEVMRRELLKKRYRLSIREGKDKIFLLGRKRTLGWFGSDVVHLGLIVILGGGILSGLLGFRQNLTFHEGQTIPIADTNFSVRLDRFVTEYYPNGRVKDWKSHLTVIEAGEPLLQKAIEVNHPLRHRGYSFYQSGYGWDWERAKLEVWMKKGDQPQATEKIFLQVGGKQSLDGGKIWVVAHHFLPDFVLDERRQPTTRSLEPNNPAVFLEAWREEEKIFAGWIFARFPDFKQMHGTEATDLSFEFKNVEAPSYSVIQLAKDPGVPLIWLGCAVLTVGLFLAFYWPSREIRVIIEESDGKSEVIAGGTASKGRETFEQEFAAMMDRVRRSQ